MKKYFVFMVVLLLIGSSGAYALSVGTVAVEKDDTQSDMTNDYMETGESFRIIPADDIDWSTLSAAASESRLVIVYGADGDIFYHLYDLEKSEFIQEEAKMVNPCSHGKQTNPDVAMNEYGEFVVTWEVATTELYDSNYDPYAEFGGAVEDSVISMDYEVVNLDYGPCVDMYDVSYDDIRWGNYDESFGRDIALRVFDNDGGYLEQDDGVFGEVLVNSHGTSWCDDCYERGIGSEYSPAVTMTKDKIVVGWQSEKKSDGNWGVYAKDYDFDGKKISLIEISYKNYGCGNNDECFGAIDGEIPLFSDESGDKKNVELVAGEIDGSAVFVAVWQHKENGKYKAIARMFDQETGKSLTNSMSALEGSSEEVVYPKIALEGDDDNKFVVVWHGRNRKSVKGTEFEFNSERSSISADEKEKVLLLDEELSGDCHYLLDAASGVCSNLVLSVASYENNDECEDLYGDVTEGSYHQNYVVYYPTKESSTIKNPESIIEKIYPAVTSNELGEMFYVYGTYATGEIYIKVEKVTGVCEDGIIRVGGGDSDGDGDNGDGEKSKVFYCREGADSDGDEVIDDYKECWPKDNSDDKEWECRKEESSGTSGMKVVRFSAAESGDGLIKKIRKFLFSF